jgi:acyl carrier protein
MRRQNGLDLKNYNDIEYLMNEIAGIVEDVSGLEASDPKAALSDQKIDSIMLLDILTLLENRFQIVLNEELIKEFTSINRIAYIVQQSLRNLKSPPKSRITPVP